MKRQRTGAAKCATEGVATAGHAQRAGRGYGKTVGECHRIPLEGQCTSIEREGAAAEHVRIRDGSKGVDKGQYIVGRGRRQPTQCHQVGTGDGVCDNDLGIVEREGVVATGRADWRIDELNTLGVVNFKGLSGSQDVHIAQRNVGNEHLRQTPDNARDILPSGRCRHQIADGDVAPDRGLASDHLNCVRGSPEGANAVGRSD